MNNLVKLFLDPELRMSSPQTADLHTEESMRSVFIRMMRGHGLLCVLLGCRYPYWHGRNYHR